MAEAFLDSSIVIGLHFRHAEERARCAKAIPEGAEQITSRYVIFEISRGFLCSVLLLHNISFEYDSFAELHEAAHSGQQRFKPYRMQTWLGCFDDYFAVIESKDGPIAPSEMLAEFRAKLRTWARRGWKHMQTRHLVTNTIGCREDIQPPFVRTHDRRLHQELRTAQCGNPASCGLDAYFSDQARSLSDLLHGLQKTLEVNGDQETKRRVAALTRLLAKSRGQVFDGKDCHNCGDALICHEAPASAVVVSKNKKHFAALCELQGKVGAWTAQ